MSELSGWISKCKLSFSEPKKKSNVIIMVKISHTGKPGEALALFTFTIPFVPVHFVLYYFVCPSSLHALMFRLS